MYIGKMVKTEWKSEKGCLAVFFHVLGFHNSFLCISNFVDIFIVVQKIISWKVGKSVNMLTRWFAFPPYRLCDVLCVKY